MKVEVYECHFCKTLHRNEKDYDVCVQKCTAKSLEIISKDNAKKEMEYLRNYVRLNAESLDDIERLANEVINKINPNVEKISIEFDMRYDNNVSNTHYCPLNGVKNWIGNINIPRGYKGFIGKIKFKVNESENKSLPDIGESFKLGIIGIHIATSGSMGKGFTGECIIFLDDFPKIKENVERVFQLKEEYHKQCIQSYALFDDFIKTNHNVAIYDNGIRLTDNRIDELKKKIEVLRDIRCEQINERDIYIDTHCRNKLNESLTVLIKELDETNVNKINLNMKML